MEKLQALWAKLTADKTIDEKDLQALEKEGMSREEAIIKARNEELTVRISGNKASEDGVGDKIVFTTTYDGVESTVKVPLNKDCKVLSRNNDVQSTLDKTSFVETRMENNQYIGIKPDGTKVVIEDVALLAEGVKSKEKQEEIARNEAIKDSAAKGVAIGVGGAFGVAAPIVSAIAGAAGAMIACGPDLKESDMRNTLIGVQLNDNASLAENVLLLVNAIKADNEKLAGYMQQLITALNNLSTKYDKECEKNDEFRKNLFALLEQIKTGLTNLPESLKPYFTAIVSAIDGNTEKLEELIKLAKLLNEKASLIKEGVSEGNEQRRIAVEKILEALSKLNFNMVGGMNTILKAILGNGTKLDKIYDVVSKIEGMVYQLNQLITKYGDKGLKLGNSILCAIGKLNFTVDVDLKGVQAFLDKLVKGQINNGKKIDNLTEVVEKMGLAILNKMNYETPDYSQQLETIISLLSNINPAEVDLSKLESLLGDAVNGVNNNTQLLKNITKQNDIIIDLIKSFAANTGRQLDGLDKWLAKIYAKIPQGGTNTLNIDLTSVLNKLDEILEAIKKIPTTDKIKVDITGKVTCTCNCGGNNNNGGGVHEGIIGNLEDILG